MALENETWRGRIEKSRPALSPWDGPDTSPQYSVCRNRDTLVAAIEWLDPKQEWTGLFAIGMVEARRQVGERVSVEQRYYLTSLGQVRPFARAARGHWGIENSLHWVLDVAFGEDSCRIRKEHAPQNLATLRHLALNLLRQDKSSKTGLKIRRSRAGWDNDCLLQVLTGPAN